MPTTASGHPSTTSSRSFEAEGAAAPRAVSIPLVAGALALAGLVIRLLALGEHELWVDEAATLHRASREDWLQATFGSSTSPVFLLLLKGWVAVAGVETFALRLLPMLAGSGFVAAMTLLGARLVDTGTGMAAGLWAALSPLHVYYSHEVRPYSLLTLALALAALTLLRALEAGTLGAWAMHVGCAVLAVHAHLLAALPLIVMAAFAVKADSKRWRPAAALAVAGLLSLPWFVAGFVAPDEMRVDGSTWIASTWERTPPALAVPKSMELLALGNHEDFVPVRLRRFETPFSPWLRLPAVAAMLALGMIAAVRWGDDRLGEGARGVRMATWCVLLLPLVVTWCVSWWWPLYVAGRYDLVVQPAVLLLLAIAVSKVRRMFENGGFIAAALVLPCVLAQADRVGSMARDGGDEHARTARTLVETVDTADVVVFTGLRAAPVTYPLLLEGYRWQDGRCVNAETGHAFGCRTFPVETESTTATLRPVRIDTVSGAVSADVDAHLSTFGDPPQSVHVILGEYAHAKGRLAATRRDQLLLAELQRRGYAPVGADIELGIMRLRSEAGRSAR